MSGNHLRTSMLSKNRQTDTTRRSIATAVTILVAPDRFIILPEIKTLGLLFMDLGNAGASLNDPPNYNNWPSTSSAIAERPRCRVGQLWPKVEDWNWETIFYGHYMSPPNILLLRKLG